MTPPSRLLSPAVKIVLLKTNGRCLRPGLALACASLLVLEACLSPDPRFHQIDRHKRETAPDTVRHAPAASVAREPARNKEQAEATSRAAAPAPPVPESAASTAPQLVPGNAEIKRRGKALQSNDPELKIMKEGERTFGRYRLKSGEALYSAVVVRFTGRVEAEDVNQIARELMILNNIADETQIPTGAEIRIPVELIDEAFFTVPAPPLRAPPRRGYFQHVILDAGHGGNDPGTIVRSVREDEVAFDLLKRIRSGLVKRGVNVHTLVSAHPDAGQLSNGHAVREGKRHQYLQVTPIYDMEDSRIALNLRIYLVEDIYHSLLRQGVAPEDIVFISIHLDHLHPSVGGTMIYIPDAEERVANFKASGEVYAKFSESRDQTIVFDLQQNRLAETASQAFAQSVIASLRRASLLVHKHQPVRRYVYRGGSKWTPGVIRYSRVPVSVLIEAANLTHRADWQRIRSADFRERWANAVVRAIVSTN